MIGTTALHIMNAPVRFTFMTFCLLLYGQMMQNSRIVDQNINARKAFNNPINGFLNLLFVSYIRLKR